MPTSTRLNRLICERHALDSSQWFAWDVDQPYRRSCGDHPAAALRRFLETHVEGELQFELFCDRDLAGNGQNICQMRWLPPDLLLECTDCRATGKYIGLFACEVCQSCNGQGAIKILS